MKILLISPVPPPYGGIANWTAMMLEYIKETNDIFRTINIAPKKRGTEGRNLFDRIFVSGFDMLKKNHLLKKELKEYKPDVIHMTTSGSLAIIRDLLLLKTARKYKVPVVYHIRFGKTRQMAEQNSKTWKLFTKAMRNANVVAAIDKNTYEAICEYVPGVNAVLVPNPINLSKLPKEKDRKRQVVFLGWVVPTKGVKELVSVWNKVGEKYSDYELLIIGQSKPEYLSNIKKLSAVKNIAFLGEMQHNDAMKVVAESEVFVLPSYTEGFPNAVLEAMALGNVVVATKVGAIPEMLSDECGVLISPQNEEELVEALERVLSDSECKKKMSKNAMEKVIREYSIEKVYSQYRKIWQDAKGDRDGVIQ